MIKVIIITVFALLIVSCDCNSTSESVDRESIDLESIDLESIGCPEVQEIVSAHYRDVTVLLTDGRTLKLNQPRPTIRKGSRICR